jgi:hypothetical protein
MPPRALVVVMVLCGCGEIIDLKVPVTRIEVGITGRCATPNSPCSRAALANDSLSLQAGGDSSPNFFNFPDKDVTTARLQICEVKPKGFVVFHGSGGSGSVLAVEPYFEPGSPLMSIRSQRYTHLSDRGDYFGSYALYDLNSDGTTTVPVPTNLWPVLEAVEVDGGTRVYEFQLSRNAEDGGVELDPAGLIVREVHTISTSTEDVQIDYLPSCPAPTPGGPSGSWLW